MAGTTVDEDNVVYKTLLSSINREGFDFSLEQVLELGAGKEKKKAIAYIIATQLSPTEDATELTDDIYNDFITSLKSAYEVLDIKPQPGAEKVFEELHEKGIRVVLNTGYDSYTANSILEKLQWKIGVQIDALVTASDVPNNRPHPDMIWMAMKLFDIQEPKQVVKVGDSAVDIEEGKNAGCGLSIGITTGAHTYEQLSAAGPNLVINRLKDLLSWV